ncbi:uncharacterized protein LOC126601962 [Malus sylvestris]|uniref:uncharacterized protein LOC126601962 n=1 Tax=Malus sylvestris TaxID=3752 RepID=UPI0021ABF117|nr:uncharacterized protein LOC126601962 [Malus sylvestris]
MRTLTSKLQICSKKPRSVNIKCISHWQRNSKRVAGKFCVLEPLKQDIFSFGAIKSATDFQEYNEVAGVSALDFGYTNNTAVTSFTLYKSTLQYQSTRETKIRGAALPFNYLWNL